MTTQITNLLSSCPFVCISQSDSTGNYFWWIYWWHNFLHFYRCIPSSSGHFVWRIPYILHKRKQNNGSQTPGHYKSCRERHWMASLLHLCTPEKYRSKIFFYLIHKTIYLSYLLKQFKNVSVNGRRFFITNLIWDQELQQTLTVITYIISEKIHVIMGISW